MHLLQMKHPLHHKLLQNKQMQPQSRVLSPLYNLQLLLMSTTMRMKLKCLQWAIKEFSMRIVLKRTPPILFQQKRLPLAPQLVKSLAPLCQKEGEAFPAKTPKSGGRGSSQGDKSPTRALRFSNNTGEGSTSSAQGGRNRSAINRHPPLNHLAQLKQQLKTKLSRTKKIHLHKSWLTTT